MKIAVVGSGFLGLACAYELSALGKVSVFDKRGIGKGASGIAAGLLHPFAGKKATLNYKGREAFEEARRLLDVASQTLDKKVYRQTGIFRPAVTSESYTFYKASSEVNPECIWQENPPGIFIASGIQVDCPLYLEGLWQACQAKDVQFHTTTISSVNDLCDFDLVLFCIGYEFDTISGLPNLHVSAVKGQALELEYDKELPFAISFDMYVSQVRPGTIVAGSTYEHSWDTTEPDRAFCEEKIRTKVSAFAPEFAYLPLLGVRAGFRATTPDKKPFIRKVAPNCYCLGGLGSKGLLYHAFLAKRFIAENVV